MTHSKRTHEERAAQRRKWAVEHPEKCRQYGRDFYARNSQKRRDASLAYYYAHKEERSAYAKVHYQQKRGEDPSYLEKIYARQKAARRRNAPVLSPRRDPWEIKVSRCRKTLSEYSYRSMESIQAQYPRRVEQYFQNFPFDQYGHGFICNVLYRFRIYRDRAEYDDCYEAGMVDSPGFFAMFWNSVIISVCILAGQLLVDVSAAWALAQLPLKGKMGILNLYIVLMLMPFQVLMFPQYLVLNDLKILDTLGAVILPAVFSTFPVFILHRFFKAVPPEILEAARLDGAGEFRIFFQIGIPMGIPGILSVCILTFCF